MAVPRPRIVSRSGWGARAPRSRSSIRTPTPRVFIHHSADDRQGAAAMRAHQTFHMNTKRWSDLAYSFCIENSGTIFEGRGVGISGGHTQGHNSTSHGICLLGNFENRTPPAAMIQSLVHLLAHGADMRWWNLDIRGHRDVGRTACPGRHVQNRLPDIRNQVAAMRSGSSTAAVRPPAPAPQLPEDPVTPQDIDNIAAAVWRRVISEPGMFNPARASQVVGDVFLHARHGAWDAPFFLTRSGHQSFLVIGERAIGIRSADEWNLFRNAFPRARVLTNDEVYNTLLPRLARA